MIPCTCGGRLRKTLAGLTCEACGKTFVRRYDRLDMAYCVTTREAVRVAGGRLVLAGVLTENAILEVA